MWRQGVTVNPAELEEKEYATVPFPPVVVVVRAVLREVTTSTLDAKRLWRNAGRTSRRREGKNVLQYGIGTGTSRLRQNRPMGILRFFHNDWSWMYHFVRGNEV